MATQQGFAEVNGTTLYYEVAGEGQPLVLNHGGLVDNHLWDDHFAVLAQYFKVIRYDIRGFGASGIVKKDTTYSLERDLHSLLQFLGIEKTYMLGLSMGGTLSIDFTLQYPEMVDALIPVGAGLSGFDPGEPDADLKAKFAAMEDAFKRRDIPAAVEVSLQLWTDGPERTPDQVDPEVREVVRAMTTHNFERADDQDVEPQAMEPPAAGRLSEIHVPTLVIVGGQDAELILRIADMLVKDIPGAKKAIIPDTAHHPNMEKPEEFNRIVLDFLQSL